MKISDAKIENSVINVKIKYISSHGRVSKKTPSGEHGGLDIESLDTEIDDNSLKRLQA